MKEIKSSRWKGKKGKFLWHLLAKHALPRKGLRHGHNTAISLNNQATGVKGNT